MRFFKRLNFTSSNEDGASEVATLMSAKRILCLTASGGRALDLLLTNANEIIALDMNRAQNALLALKMVAIRHLDYHDYLKFIGVIEDNTRLVTFGKLIDELSLEDRNYWQKNKDQIKKGLWYAGVWERVLCVNSKILKLFKGKKIAALFEASTMGEQVEIWQREFDKPILRFMVRLAANRFLWTHVIGEPGGAFLPPSHQVAEILASRFSQAASHFYFRDSDFATLIFNGKQSGDQPALPLHMQEVHYKHIQDNLNRIRIVTGPLDQLQNLNLSAFDGFSLSDFGSYCNQVQYTACWKSIIEASVDQAHFCERLFMVNHQLPFDALHPDDALSTTLSVKDKAIIYQIRAGKIEKNNG